MLNLKMQRLVYSQLSRMELLEYEPESSYLIRIGIYRNHSFELIENTIALYLDFAGYKAEFVYSDYDDSLSFFELDKTTDLLILWMDLTRYQSGNLQSFFEERISYLKSIYKKPILAAFVGKEGMELGINKFPIREIADSLQEDFWDLRLEPFSGTKISLRGLLEISRQLGLNYIPSLIDAALKVIVLDLDNTLYKGVLGEDGYSGIELTEGHKKLQKKLLELKREGFFLCVISKNEEKDVLEMFHLRKDFLLKAEDFSKICCSWEAKSNSILEIASYLNVGADSFLFVDDNPGELMEMEKIFPEVKKLLAYENAGETAYMIENYPGIKKLIYVYEDSIRNADIEANQRRSELRKNLTNDEYIKSLHIKLVFYVDMKEQVSRISVLANKTNQFIFNYKRYTQTEIMDLMNDENAVVVSVELSDDLSDSGIIAACVGELKNQIIEISELFISCRALGRGIDNIIISGSIQLISDILCSDKILIKFQHGERNLPAEKYVKENLNPYINVAEVWNYNYPKEFIEIICRR